MLERGVGGLHAARLSSAPRCAPPGPACHAAAHLAVSGSRSSPRSTALQSGTISCTAPLQTSSGGPSPWAGQGHSQGWRLQRLLQPARRLQEAGHAAPTVAAAAHLQHHRQAAAHKVERQLVKFAILLRQLGQPLLLACRAGGAPPHVQATMTALPLCAVRQPQRLPAHTPQRLQGRAGQRAELHRRRCYPRPPTRPQDGGVQQVPQPRLEVGVQEGPAQRRPALLAPPVQPAREHDLRSGGATSPVEDATAPASAGMGLPNLPAAAVQLHSGSCRRPPLREAPTPACRLPGAPPGPA